VPPDLPHPTGPVDSGLISLAPPREAAAGVVDDAPDAQLRRAHPPQVTFVLPEGPIISGVTTWTLELASQLADRALPVQIVEHGHQSAAESSSPEPFRRRRVDLPDPHFPTETEVHRYASAYGSAMPGVIVPNYSRAAYGGCAALARRRAPGLRTLGFAHTDSDYFYELLTYYEPIIHHFVAVSDVVAERLSARLPSRAEDISMRPYGVRVESGMRRTYSSAGESLRLVYAGRLAQEQKRVLDLIPLVRNLAALDVEFDLLVAGDGAARAELERRIAGLSLPTRSRVRIAGAVPHQRMDSIWAEADLCILLSDFEGTSLAMLEAMARGCVPVVTDVSGARMLISSGVNGFTVPVGATEEMARVIGALARQREKLPILGGQAHRSAASYSSETYADWFCSLLARTWAEPPRAWPRGLPIIPRPGIWGSRPLLLAAGVLERTGLRGPAQRQFRSLADRFSVLASRATQTRSRS
jgi:glycosyltransferase involved in cell wall biosynthesis